MPGPESAVDRRRQLGLAVLLMGKGQEGHREAAGLALGEPLQGHLEAAPVGIAREQGVAVDQVEQRHRLLFQGMDNVAVVDDVDMGARLARPPARQGQVAGAAEEEFEAVVIEAHAEAVADEARGHGVEHPLQGEAAR